MADFKVSDTLSEQISALRQAGNSVNESSDKLNESQIDSLKTAKQIAQQHNAIKQLLEAYKALVLKDAKDLDAFVAEAKKMDSAVSISNQG